MRIRQRQARGIFVIVVATHTVVVEPRNVVGADVAEFRDGKATLDGKEHPGVKRTSGHIGFLGHGDEVHFRNIRVRPLAKG